jgi:hypothetical protein
VCVQPTFSLNPISTPGTPINPTPYTLSSPGTVTWLSHSFSSPSHGKCGLATTIPAPLADFALPIAHPLLPIPVALPPRSPDTGPPGRTSPAPGGCAVAR